MKHLHVLAFGALATATATAADPAASYSARLEAVNAAVVRSDATGEAHFKLDGDTLAIEIRMRGVPADMVHWQHLHGFADGRDAACPSAQADANGDGVVDLVETEKSAGTTLVPFDAMPAAMDVAHGDYPSADADGAYHYAARVPVQALQAAFAKAFPGQQFDLEKRVVFIHGVPADTRLPDSVASLGPIPAYTTLPIACGRIVRVIKHQ
jgi:hypothetical protein